MMTNIQTGVVSMITLRYLCAHWLVLIALGSAATMASSYGVEEGAQADDNKPLITNQPHEKTGNSYLPGIGISAPAALPSFGLSNSVQVNTDSKGNNFLNDAANEPSIAVDPTAPNRMAIGWRQFDNTQSNFRQAGWAYSNDGGRTWTFPGVIEPGVFRTDPVLDFDTEGNFYYNSLRVTNEYDCQVFKSTDGGVSWGEAVWAWGGDKQWMVIDRTDGIGHGNIYANWTLSFSVCDGQFTRSYDGNLTYLDCIYIPNNPQWGTLAVGPSGELYIAGREFVILKSSSMQDESLPPHFDFVAPVDMGGDIQAFISGGPNPAGLLGQAHVVVNHAEGPMLGEVYMLCSVNPPSADPLDVHFVRSTDGGATWSIPIRLNDDQVDNAAWQWFGTMSVAPNGRIDVVFNDTRNTGQPNMSELFYTFSTNGGRTWSPNIQLSPVYNSWLGWPNQNKIGDYYHMISDNVGANLAWSATFNGEQDVYFLRIGDYDCNANGKPDSDDIDSGESSDCNENGIPDNCEIAAGAVKDDNGDGIPDECTECPWDLDGDVNVGTSDLLELFAQWGTAGPADFDGSGVVDTNDLLILFANWGPCP
ncbi:MAG: exo-alpha-sialidase [Planctomycetes bacterium]|nr:exo-alpha-sialidase [Planctomycetota bacterium]